MRHSTSFRASPLGVARRVIGLLVVALLGTALALADTATLEKSTLD